MPITYTPPVPVEHTLDPGEVVIPSAAVDTMTSIVSLNDTPVAKPESDTNLAALLVAAIIIYFIVKLILRFLPFVLGVGLIVILLTML